MGTRNENVMYSQKQWGITLFLLSINLTIGSMDSKELEEEFTYGTMYWRWLLMSWYRVKIMRDGTVWFLSISWRYYIRHMYKWKSYVGKPRQCFNWDRIEYYDLRWNYIPLAMAECSNCGDIIQSQYCWHFVTCSCWDTSVDTDRWFPERHRIFSKDK